MKRGIEIKPLGSERFDDFFSYLEDHISDNGKNHSDLFLPISRDNLVISEELIDNFRDGQSTSIDELGWRRVLIALDNKNKIVGHIDLKSHNQNYTNHRAVMGMGVHRDYRKEGLGHSLIQSISDWAKKETHIERIDLWVLSKNSPAIRLYEKAGFQKIGEVEDMFRIDGNSHNFLMMTKRIGRIKN